MRRQLGHQLHGGDPQSTGRCRGGELTAAGAQFEDAEGFIRGGREIRAGTRQSQQLVDALVVGGLDRSRVAAGPGGLAGVEGGDPGWGGGGGVSHDTH